MLSTTTTITVQPLGHCVLCDGQLYAGQPMIVGGCAERCALAEVCRPTLACHPTAIEHVGCHVMERVHPGAFRSTEGSTA